MSKSGSHIAGFLSGLAIGGLLGLLYAPEKGSQTRARLAFELDKYKKKLESLLGELRSQDLWGPNQAKEDGASIVESAKRKAEKLLGDVDGLIHKINPTGERKKS